ncbi:hypothetical protein [Paraburkholderia lycopersici]|uniref:Uncharacterized protein n=1 Tax=Paraburkholderia lycopersici TaxID=416944 RepID=A0A1G6RH27_9BURK|nr:hypothetical protein [Paraburkholderia lycopersici]SDD03305.1 hypothetical protein SAMN05421548_113109 [Paraburkholderia lycopersici]
MFHGAIYRLAHGVFTAEDVWTAVRNVLEPPGWRADGNGDTTEDLRRRHASAAVRAAPRARVVASPEVDGRSPLA